MAHIVINGINLLVGGGPQIVGGLLARLGDEHHYTLIWNREQAMEQIRSLAGERNHIRYDRPLASTSNFAGFAWLMRGFPGYAKAIGADLVFNINMHVPCGPIPQIVYHMNVLRFDRPKAALASMAEIADRLRDWRARKALTNAQCNVFESHYLADIAEAKAGSAKAKRIIYIGLDDQMAAPVIAANRASGANILAITSPAVHKDNGVLIAMLAHLAAQRPEVDWRLTIAGGREGKASFPELTAEADRLGLGERIDWLGYVDHATLAQHGAQALCLVSASRVESFCMVALEAMSWGCPAIVANATAMPESIADAGLLAEPGNAAEFAVHVLTLYDNPDQRAALVERGLKLASARSWTQAARAFEAEFAAILTDAQKIRDAA